ncbi:Aste57867_9384 [Aphanomyces stellatus]|uniref:Aste57867_9384 protein n=1 Tax=Aphanomyces stellatus TaxID=120398 RepID=A0A485KMN2_9STRA|nr:hypothetical protein As57867_009348 [Aphanomyces stellatus]VFT86265.1 Aste57867_9384 [Aphanomyces stellatus]
MEVPCDASYQTTFSVSVCSECRFNLPHFKLITKDMAKKTFLLPDSSLEVLPCLRKANPKHEGFAQLRLYLTQACQAAAIQLHGSLDNIADEKRRRERARYDKAVQRTKSVVEVFGKRRKGKLGAPGGKPARRMPPPEDEDHKHIFKEPLQQDDGSWVKECACGLSVTFHKM